MPVKKSDIKPLLQSGYLPQSEAELAMKRRGYNYDSDLSSMETKVFVKDGKPVIVHRGTTTAKDMVDDSLLAIGLGKAGHRYKNARRVTKKAEEKYGQAADTLGHSYGGWLAEHSGGHGHTTTYNKAVGLADLGKHISNKQTDIRTDRDLVSYLSNTQTGGHKQTIKYNDGIPLNFIAAHSIDNL